MYLHYSFYNYSELDKTTEWDLSGRGLNGNKTDFPNSLEYTPKNTLGPPASYSYTGNSIVETTYIGDISIPYTITFWATVGDLSNDAFLFRTNNSNDIRIGINKTSKKITINGEETLLVSNSKFDFFAVVVEENSIKVIKNGSEEYSIVGSREFSNKVFTLLENFIGKFSDFAIHEVALSLDKINILYRSIMAINRNGTTYIPSIHNTNKRETLPEAEKNKIGKNKKYNMETMSEYNISGEALPPIFENLEFTLRDISDIPDSVGGIKKRSPYPVGSELNIIDSLCYLEVTIKSSLTLSGVTLTASNQTGSLLTNIQTRSFNPIPANTTTTLFILFRTLDKNISKYELSFGGSSEPSIEFSNIRIVNLTHSGIESFLLLQNLKPTYNPTNNSYTCGKEIINWCESAFKGKPFSNKKSTYVISEENNEFKILNAEEKKSGFTKLWKESGVISKEINEFSGI